MPVNHKTILARSHTNNPLDEILIQLFNDTRRIKEIICDLNIELQYILETDREVIRRIYYKLVEDDYNR